MVIAKNTTASQVVSLSSKASMPLFLPAKTCDPPPNAPKPASLLGWITTTTVKTIAIITSRTVKNVNTRVTSNYVDILP